MPIPDFDNHGLLPGGVYDCNAADIRNRFAWNPKREALFNNLERCLAAEVRPSFPDPVLIDGSFVTDKADPEDTDIVLDVTAAPPARMIEALLFQKAHQARLWTDYGVHFWVDLIGSPFEFSAFFQYIGIKTAHLKGLHPKHPKGILRLI
jgi:hypothetical protein